MRTFAPRDKQAPIPLLTLGSLFVPRARSAVYIEVVARSGN